MLILEDMNRLNLYHVEKSDNKRAFVYQSFVNHKGLQMAVHSRVHSLPLQLRQDETEKVVYFKFDSKFEVSIIFPF